MNYEELDEQIKLLKEDLKFQYHMLETVQRLITKFLDGNNTPDAWRYMMQFNLFLSQEIISQRNAIKKFENVRLK